MKKKGRNKQGEKKRTLQTEINEKTNISEDEEMATNKANNGGEGHVEEEAGALAAVRADIRMITQEMKIELGNFRASIREDLKKEISGLREEIQLKLGKMATDLQAVNKRIEGAEERVAGVEELSTDIGEALNRSLQAQGELQAKLTDLEARSRRNNLRIYGLKEGAEDNNIQQFIGNFIKGELEPLAEIELGIQRCHRALGPPPPSGAPPRSVIVCFQEYKVKELVLHSAWKKKEVHFGDKRLYFDHDFPTETLAKRKAYTQIRRALREKGIRFQTPPPAKLRVFFATGPVTYGSADEAAADLKKKGFVIEEVKRAGPKHAEGGRGEAQQRQSSTSTPNTQREHQALIKERLRGFQRMQK